MNEEVIDVCVIEDDHTERKLLLHRFQRLGYSVVQAADGTEGLEQIRRHAPRVIVCDVLMPGMTGIELCKAVRSDESLAGIYLILVTAYDSQKRKRDALNAGADDYLIKPYDAAELEAKVRNGLRISRLQENLRKAALTDGLTGLWNHAQFREQLDVEFARTRRYGGCVSLLMIDIDHFKAVNDTYGHEQGNRVLRQLAKHLQRSVREMDTVARYGGEEFAAICPQTPLEEAVTLAERIRETVPQRVRIPEHPELVIRTSIGIACSSDTQVHSAQDLVSRADQALYLAKSKGRNQVRRSEEVGNLTEEEGVRIDDVDRLRKEIVTLSMQSKELCLQSVWALVQALEARDPFTAEHSRNVTFYVQRLAEAAGWPENQRTAVANAAMLHDLGKIGVADSILQKPTPLRADEAAVLRQVPLMTCKILEPLRVFETETLIIRHLRERYDGSGYPEGLRGRDIPIGSRLLAVAETFDALTSDRVHRPSRSLDDSVAEIRSEAGAHFDPQFVDLLVGVVGEERERWQRRVALSSDTTARGSLVSEHV